MVSATSKGSDQPAHSRSLIRAFALPFGVSKLKRRLHRLVWVYKCQHATLLEITCRGLNDSNMVWYMDNNGIDICARIYLHILAQCLLSRHRPPVLYQYHDQMHTLIRLPWGLYRKLVHQIIRTWSAMELNTHIKSSHYRPTTETPSNKRLAGGQISVQYYALTVDGNESSQPRKHIKAYHQNAF